MDNKQKALQAAISYLERNYGKNAVVCLGDDSAAQNVEVFSSGLLGLDRALGIGGIPRGRIIEVFGPEASGKTSLTLKIAAAAQKLGETVALVDAEHALDVVWAQTLGVDTKKLLVSQPSSGDEALDVAEKLVNSHAVGLIIVDSVAALVPRAEMEANVGDDVPPGGQARMMSQALRKLASQVNLAKTAVIFINQLRYKIGAPGNPETTPGGNALKFYASVRLDVRQTGLIKDKADEKRVIGRGMRVRVVKNKLAPPFREAHFDVIFTTGIDATKDAIAQGLELKIIVTKGSDYYFQGKKVGTGIEETAAWLKGNAAAKRTIRDAVAEAIQKSREAAPTGASTDDEEPPKDE